MRPPRVGYGNCLLPHSQQHDAPPAICGGGSRELGVGYRMIDEDARSGEINE